MREDRIHGHQKKRRVENAKILQLWEFNYLRGKGRDNWKCGLEIQRWTEIGKDGFQKLSNILIERKLQSKQQKMRAALLFNI